MAKLLVYAPGQRLTAHQCLAHPFFDELRDPRLRLPNGNPLPELFNFNESGTFIFSVTLSRSWFCCVFLICCAQSLP